jgi:hypothetical protein
LSRILIEMAGLTWNLSYMFALVPKALAAKGAHLRYGYVHCEPGRWVGPDRQITDEDHLIWMSSEDMGALFAEAPPRLLAREPALATGNAPASQKGISVVGSVANG